MVRNWQFLLFHNKENVITKCLFPVMGDRHFSSFSDLQNRVAAVWKTVFQNTFCVRRGLGRSLNKQKNRPCRESGFEWFFVFVATHALLAKLQCVKHKHCLLILCSDLIVSKTGKQCMWRAICEKTPFPIPSEAVFFNLLGKLPIPSHCKFFAGYAHICALLMQKE